MRERMPAAITFVTMNTPVESWKITIVTLLLITIFLDQAIVVPGHNAKSPTESVITQFVESGKISAPAGNEVFSKIPVLLFVLVFVTLTQTSGKKIGRKLLITVERRNCFYNHVTIHAP